MGIGAVLLTAVLLAVLEVLLTAVLACCHVPLLQVRHHGHWCCVPHAQPAAE
jgi:hypothetical protein